MLSKIANKNIRFSSNVVKLILEEIEKNIRIGACGKDLEKIAIEIMKQKKVKSSAFGYQGFPSHICVSVNNELTHGIPNSLPFKSGDIVSVDVACNYHGFHADSARTFLVFDKEKVDSSEELFSSQKKLIEVTKNSLSNAISLIKPGETTNKDIGIFIQKYVEERGFFPIKEYGGHGIGKLLHLDPFIPNCLIDGIEEFTIKPGMVICIEPLVQFGSNQILISDNFVILSKNGELNAHFEHTILIGTKGVEVLV